MHEKLEIKLSDWWGWWLGLGGIEGGGVGFSGGWEKKDGVGGRWVGDADTCRSRKTLTRK